ncbi:PREDICTED: FACT complex subunit SPT16-like [Nelumbo nucifera]|uniref:FACT complex subunit n=2 Tax=Nelumbo nucifera TaxID=4432 RepID=A0A1U8Q3I3_NELNU|nr:PREDICTED: FACT complex subunit SPT16-like [Nelumbo nucifera]XP_010249964.1 PREDICTED: FACT complex subunit SPT16-like [Nelumbo nucifera]XP_010249973.1 PREDICTED: FACT complex subunit SPT16-like [Nelumbo nucifera]XP_010249981.1 PREDICTED: FACT complex subunit SPT16-like [Nelumbo nucifera]XP_019052586.1 PREDICTED: FACT complex subunit SPT16-like [Nelumbo nucifera]DAD35998.1 TPA_asm: hypothetical protein HUJ06_006638 [Nelumbo nucifera]
MNLRAFKKRLRLFYSSWKERNGSLWCDSNVLLLCTPPPPADGSPSAALSHPVTSAFYVWLLGHDFPDTIAVFTYNGIYFVCTKKKASLLKKLVPTAMEAENVVIAIHEKVSKDNGYALMDEILQAVRDRFKSTLPPFPAKYNSESDGNRPFVIGLAEGEFPRSKLLWTWSRKAETDECRTVYVNSALSRLFGVKADKALNVDLHMKALPKGVEEALLLDDERRTAEDLSEKTIKSEKEAEEAKISKQDCNTQLSISLPRKNERADALVESTLDFDDTGDWVVV